MNGYSWLVEQKQSQSELKTETYPEEIAWDEVNREKNNWRESKRKKSWERIFEDCAMADTSEKERSGGSSSSVRSVLEKAQQWTEN